jgi:signal transduction histidine kinase
VQDIPRNQVAQQQIVNTQANAVNTNKDYNRRLAYGQTVRQQMVGPNSPPLKPVRIPSPTRFIVRHSPQLVPVWLSSEGGPEKLLLVRRVEIGSKRFCQGVVVDWPRLQKLLSEQIEDLLVHAKFVPMHDTNPPRPDRTMTALPIEVDPGESTSNLTLPAWTPLRIGLAVAWGAVGLALLATWLVGWSLLDLSERRSRFVSAVTHELRTPLTTLRLYLDMLTSGLIRDEQQKVDYLQTLHTEADRLNRLIANVLDFSRLENQRPRLEKKQVNLADLLEQLRSTWQARCQAADKELLIENETSDAPTLLTDPELVEQILGNLIDNACKYSRAAEDRRILVRAHGEGRQLVLEVVDHGPGISPRDHRSIFRPFRRGRGADVTAGGVGLGLALSQRWATLLGGKLTLSHAGQAPGANFRLELPIP